MEQKRNEDMWLGCCLGYRIGRYLSEKPGDDPKELIEVLKQIASGELTLTDPGENAARSSQFKEIFQSIGHAGIRSDQGLAQQALSQLANQRDE